MAVGLSLVALLFAGAAFYLSFRTFQAVTAATSASSTAHHTAAEPRPQPQRAASVTRAPGPGGYPVSYVREPLRVQVGCSSLIFLDLDEPRAGAGEQVADLRYESGCGDEPPRLSLGPGAAGGSPREDAGADAAGCLRAIRTSPLARGEGVEVQPGSALCVQTAATPAAVVLVEIADVGGTGTAGLRATSWRVP